MLIAEKHFAHKNCLTAKKYRSSRYKKITLECGDIAHIEFNFAQNKLYV